MRKLLSVLGMGFACVCMADAVVYEKASREGVRQLGRGQYAEAARQLETAVIAAQTFGEADARFAAANTNLARAYFAEGRYRAAEVLYRKVLAGAEKRLPPAHPDVASALSDLAELYRYLGRIEEAAPLHRRALAIRERHYEAEDLSVAESLHFLGEIHRVQRRYAEAERLYWRAVMIRSYLQGAEHPALWPSLTGLAQVNRALGRSEEAEKLYQRARTLAEKALPASRGRARLHDFAGGDSEALALSRGGSAYQNLMPASSLAERERLQASENPELARQLEGLAEIYAAQGRFAAALELVRRVLVMREGALGALHPEVGQAYGSLARILADLGQNDAALTAARAATRQLATQPEKRRWESGFLLHVALLAERAQGDPAALAESFAVMQNLARLPRTLELADAQKLLRANEALVAFAAADDARYLWIVRARQAFFLSESSEERLQARAAPLLFGARELLLVPHGGRHGLRTAQLAKTHHVTVLPGVGALAAR